MATSLRIGQVGCGRWGRLVLRDLLSLGAEVVVAARGDTAETARLAGATAVVTDVSEFPKVDGFVVVTPTSTHAAVVERLLPLGAPIFCEKPLCEDPVVAGQLALQADGRLFVMEKWRYHGGVEALARIARSGELGPAIGLRTHRLGYGHAYEDTDCIWTLMPHDVSIATHVLAEPLTPVSAVADRAGDQVMGMVATSVTPRGAWHVAEVGMRSAEVRREITLYCANGAASLPNALCEHLLVWENPPKRQGPTEAPLTRRSIPLDMPLLKELKAFLDYLRGGAAPMSSAQEAATTVAVIARMRELAGL